MKGDSNFTVKAYACKCPSVIRIMKHPAICKKMYLAGNSLLYLFKYLEQVRLDCGLAPSYVDIFCISVKTLNFTDNLVQSYLGRMIIFFADAVDAVVVAGIYDIIIEYLMAFRSYMEHSFFFTFHNGLPQLFYPEPACTALQGCDTACMSPNTLYHTCISCISRTLHSVSFFWNL